MMATLRAEYRKLISVRSTYVLSLLAVILAAFIAFWGIGFKSGQVLGPDTFVGAVYFIISMASVFVGIVTILLVCHEYRYNTIFYTLSTSNSRLKVFLAKLSVATVYTVLLSALLVGIAFLLIMLGAKMAGHTVEPQVINWLDLSWRILVFMVGSSWFGLLLGFLSRSLVFATVGYFLLPTLEAGVIHTLLKVSNNYLPFASQGQIVQLQATPGVYSPVASAGVFGLYLAAGLLVAAVLFVRRDAN